MIDGTLHFVSIEGNWDKEIHDERIARAAMILEKNKLSFAIASATYAPAAYSSFCEGRLGEYTKDILINKYGIPAMRILPAYLFPYPSTYTIIDAFANAALIGWVSCGLRKRSNQIDVLHEPVTSEFHGLRVEMLNNRACKYLRNFNVSTKLLCKNKLSFIELEKEYPEEVIRLSQLQSKGGLIATGVWSDNGKTRSYDVLDSMKHDLAEAFKSVTKFAFSDMDTCLLSDSERLIFTLLWNHIANSKKLTNNDIENICSFAGLYFDADISESGMRTINRIIHDLKI